MDVIYFITLILITVKTIFKIKERVIDLVVYKVFTLEWFEALDVIILIFSYTNVIFWILIFIVFEDVTVPFANREKFDMYIAQTSNTNYFWIISSTVFFLLSIRLFRVIAERFLSFGILLETVKIAIKDLLNFFFALLIITMGYSIMTWLIFGDSYKVYNNMIDVLSKLFFMLFTGFISDDQPVNAMKELFFRFYFIIFLFIFALFLMKMFISIVIFRYKDLRSIIQLDIEANERIFANQGEILKVKIKNFLFCK